MALEMQKLQKEHGFNPILGCLPMLAQIPVFLGLYHVLRSFKPDPGRLRAAAAVSGAQPVVGQLRVQRHRRRPLPGCQSVRRTHRRLHDTVQWLGRLHRIQPGRGHRGVASADAAGGYRHVLQQPGLGGTAESGGRGQPADRDDEQACAVRLPARCGCGADRFLPIAIIIYWVSNNIWTFGQQHYVFGRIEKEEEAKKEEALARRAANAPAPGAKPTKPKKGAPRGHQWLGCRVRRWPRRGCHR